jgi:erythromycin esterase-like protein
MQTSPGHPSHRPLVDLIRDHAVSLLHGAGHEELLDSVGRAQFVAFGEGTHGTHDFYRHRCELTKRLIEEKGFGAVAIEADWPDTYRVNQYVRGEGHDYDAEEALRGFRRFPNWLWRNADMLDFVGWLRDFNDGMPPEKKVGIYGLDLYSLHASIEGVLCYLRERDPEAAKRARARYSCFENFGDDPQSYAFSAAVDGATSCEEEVIDQLLELRRKSARYISQTDPQSAEDFFHAEMNARIVRSAEHYYRSVFGQQAASWNIREQHMLETVQAISRHLGADAKLVLWAHNTHVGDATFCELADRKQTSLGQLIRERFNKENVRLFGYLTHAGTTTAATEWDGPAERKSIRPATPESYEGLFHDTALRELFLDFTESGELQSALSEPRLERAIGVIYTPDAERISNYIRSVLSSRYDGVFYFDHTRAVEPLERSSEWKGGEIPETYPTSF